MLCTKCKRNFGSDNDPDADSTFVCDECQDSVNLQAWKDELKFFRMFSQDVLTDAQKGRIAFLESKV